MQCEQRTHHIEHPALSLSTTLSTSLKASFHTSLFHFSLPKSFHQFAHGIHPFCFRLKVVCSFSKFLIIHLLWILTEEILHELPKWRIITVCPVDIKDMSPVIKGALNLLYDPLHMIQRKTCPVDVVLQPLPFMPNAVPSNVSNRSGTKDRGTSTSPPS